MFAQLHQIAAVLGLATDNLPNININRVCTNSKQVSGGDLFIAIVGERFDGHHYIKEAVSAGALVIIANQHISVAVSVLVVADTRLAFGKIGAWARQYYHPQVFAITGSNGKTSVKNMLAAIIAEAGGTFATLATDGNLNNDLGVPMTLCRLRKKHRYAVIELGANHSGEIRYLAELVKPNIALVNNAAAAHIGTFGSLQKLVKEKGELYQVLNREGIAIINCESKHKDFWLANLPTKHVVSFGNRGDVSASNIITTESRLQFRLHYQKQTVAIKLNFIGRHNILNALAAAACALAAGVALTKIKRGLAKAQPQSGRLSLYQLGAFKIIDDSYNANPASMHAAIDALARFKTAKVLILGVMAELGGTSDVLHLEISAYAKQAGIEYIYSLGDGAKAYRVKHFDDVDDLVAHLWAQHLGDTILIKGSRIAKMEQVYQALQKIIAINT